MKTDVRKKARNDFEKDFFKLMNNAVFGKTMENVRKHRDIKLVTTERRRNYLVSEPNYHTTKFFTEHLLAIEMKKKKDTDSFIVYIKTDDIYKDITEDIETRFDTLNYELERPFPKGKNKKVIWLMKDELGRKIMAKFVGLRAKT